MTHEELIGAWRDFRLAEGACAPKRIEHDNGDLFVEEDDFCSHGETRRRAMSDAMTSECECPRCGRPVEVEWRWALALKREVAPDSREAVEDETCELEIPRYARRAECPTCGARVVTGGAR